MTRPELPTEILCKDCGEPFACYPESPAYEQKLCSNCFDKILKEAKT